MATVQEIINYAKLIYPRANDISDSNMFTIINQLIDEIHNRLLRAKWNYDKESVFTVAGQPSYALPANCTPDNIIKVMMSTDVNGLEWEEYSYIGVLDNVNLDSGNYYLVSNDLMFLFKTGEPISTDALIISIYYYKTPIYVTSLSDTPAFDSKFHNLIKYGLIQTIASIGDNPETTIADYWQRKYDEELLIAKTSISDKFDNASLMSNQVVDFW